MYRLDELVSKHIINIDKPRPKRKRAPRKGMWMTIGGEETLCDMPVELYLKSDLAEARAAEALRGRTFLEP